jgi:hypothetical protein
VEDAGVPAALLVLAEVRESGGESFASPSEVSGRPRASEENGDVMKEARAVLVRREGKLADERPEILREGARRRLFVLLSQLLLEPEPVAVSGGGSLPEGRPKMSKDLFGFLGHRGNDTSALEAQVFSGAE